MKLFRTDKEDRVAELLGLAKQNFKFDQAENKTRLFAALDTQPKMQVETAAQSSYRFNFNLAAGFAVALVGISVTFLSAQGAVPGDKLFAVNKFRESLVLALPLSVQNRVNIVAEITNERFQALDQISIQTVTAAELAQKRLETIEESRVSFNQAVDVISSQIEVLENRGLNHEVQGLYTALDNLERAAKRREQTIRDLETKAEDERERIRIQENRKLFEKARLKAESKIIQHKTKNSSD